MITRSAAAAASTTLRVSATPALFADLKALLGSGCLGVTA